ncbi:MAG: protein phosphatase 2C domain-containing protein [Myxococcota bacterium]
MSPVSLPSNLDAVGAGLLAQAGATPTFRVANPWPYSPGTPLGQHLRIERLVRAINGRYLYLASNVDPLWRHKKCWHCGNRFNPGQAQACSYCGTPLSERRFVASVRHDGADLAGWKAWLELRMEHPAIVAPAAAFLREGRPVTIFPYHGERLMLDQPAPFPPGLLVVLMHRLASALAAMHKKGVCLAPFDASNIVIMPDGSSRFTDLHAVSVTTASDLAKHPDRPILGDIRTLCSVFSKFVDPDDAPMVEFINKGILGRLGPPARFRAALEQHHDHLATDIEEHQHAGYTDLGLVRSQNEDDWGWRRIDERTVVYVVSDGMGGYEAGEVAAATTVHVVLDEVASALAKGQTAKPALQKILTSAVHRANREVYGLATARNARVGATVVALLMIDGQAAHVAHVGDARLYQLRRGKLKPVTVDHSLVQAMVERGTIKASEARTHPKANVILNYVGQDEEIDVDVQEVRVLRGDRLLLCSDGLWGELTDDEIGWHLSTWDKPRQAIQRLVRDAYLAGGKDNTTAIIVDVK